MMGAYPKMTVQIQGHTDHSGNEKANIALSQARAESAMKYLVDHYKINPSRLTAKGFGSSDPIADNKTPAGKEKNRRILGVVSGVN